MMPLLQTAAEYCGKKIKNRSSSGSEYSSNFLTHGGPTAGFFCCIVDCRSTLSQWASDLKAVRHSTSTWVGRSDRDRYYPRSRSSSSRPATSPPIPHCSTTCRRPTAGRCRRSAHRTRCHRTRRRQPRWRTRSAMTHAYAATQNTHTSTY